MAGDSALSIQKIQALLLLTAILMIPGTSQSTHSTDLLLPGCYQSALPMMNYL